MKITELPLEGCLRIENLELQTRNFNYVKTYDSENYQDLIVSTEIEQDCTIIEPLELNYEYVIKDFQSDFVTISIPDHSVGLFGIVNCRNGIDMTICDSENDDKETVTSICDNVQVLVSSKMKACLRIESGSTAIITLKTSVPIDFKQE